MACKRLDIRSKVRDITAPLRESATGRLLTAYRDDGDLRARDRLVQLYMPLVEAFAHAYGRPGADYEELLQAGSVGLVRAIERFDPRRGDEFAALALPAIAEEVGRHLQDRSHPARLPRRLQNASLHLPRVRSELTARLGRTPLAVELAAELGVKPNEIPVLQQSIAANGDDPGEATTVLDDRILRSDVFQALDEPERPVVHLRCVRQLDRGETAAELGISEDRVRALTRSALPKLRRQLEGRAFPGAAKTAESPAAEEAPSATPATPRKGEARSGRLLVRMTPALHDELARAAERDHVSLNQFVTTALSTAVGEDRANGSPSRSPRWLPAAIVTNIVVLVVTGVVAVALLVVALDQGW
jgi:RNA polymerase sigma-B factor